MTAKSSLILGDFGKVDIPDIPSNGTYLAKVCNGEIHLLNSLARDARRNRIPEALKGVFQEIIASHDLIRIKVDFIYTEDDDITDEEISEIHKLAESEYGLFRILLGFPE